jgi:hypothetical protein
VGSRYVDSFGWSRSEHADEQTPIRPNCRERPAQPAFTRTAQIARHTGQPLHRRRRSGAVSGSPAPPPW